MITCNHYPHTYLIFYRDTVNTNKWLFALESTLIPWCCEITWGNNIELHGISLHSGLIILIWESSKVRFSMLNGERNPYYHVPPERVVMYSRTCTPSLKWWTEAEVFSFDDPLRSLLSKLLVNMLKNKQIKKSAIWIRLHLPTWKRELLHRGGLSNWWWHGWQYHHFLILMKMASHIMTKLYCIIIWQ